jgi:hypothetical protein
VLSKSIRGRPFMMIKEIDANDLQNRIAEGDDFEEKNAGTLTLTRKY